MKTHAALGAETLAEVNRRHPGNRFIDLGMQIARHHHERYDGSGYPDGLAGEAIPLGARLCALADVYDALTSERCYKAAYSHDKSRAIIVEGRGTHFDPRLVDALLAQEAAFRSVRQSCLLHAGAGE
jgi:putative two-component system response regulator